MESVNNNNNNGLVAERDHHGHHVLFLGAGRGCTISGIALLDLLEDFRPDGCVALFVGIDGGGLKVDDLGNAARGRHILLFEYFFLVLFSVLRWDWWSVDGVRW